MNALLLAAAVIAGLAIIQSLLVQWLPGVFVPVIQALLLAAAFRFPHRKLVRLTLLGATALELGSGLPGGLAFAGALVLPHAVLLALRRPRPDLPAAVRGAVSAVAVFLLLGAGHALLRESAGLPSHLVPAFLTGRLLVPSLSAGVLAVAFDAALRHRTGERILSSLGLTPA